MRENLKLPEYYHLETMHDENQNVGFNYDDQILRKTTSSIIWQNENTRGFVERIQAIVSHYVKGVTIFRNFFNIAVDKYYDKHNN